MPVPNSLNLALPFLTLTAHPAIGALLLDPRPAWIWNSQGNRVLWSNAAGIAFFGEKDMDSLLDRSFGDVHPARRHLARLASNAQVGAPILDRLHFYLDETSTTTTCLCKRLEVAGETVLLVLSTDQSDGESDNAEKRQMLLDSFAARNTIQAALVDQYGKVSLSSGPTLANLSNTTLLNTLIAEADGSDRLAAHPVPETEERAVAALARLGDEADREYLLLVHEPQADPDSPEKLDAAFLAELGEGADFQSTPEEFSQGADVFVADFGIVPDSAEQRRLDAIQRASELRPIETEETTEAGEAEAEKPNTSEEASELNGVHAFPAPSSPPNVTSLTERLPTITMTKKQEASDKIVDAGSADVVMMPFNGDRSDFARFGEPKATAPTSSKGDNATGIGSTPFEFQSDHGPYHFVWESDAVGRITHISSDLAQAVGPRNAAILGMSWPEIAKLHNMDSDGVVAHAFETRDTWTGLTVHWPVQGHDLHVPVELTGLPVFGRYHGFQGFRGFGVCDVSRAELAMPEESSTTADENRAPSALVRSDENVSGFHDNAELLSEDLIKAAKDAVITAKESVSLNGNSSKTAAEELVQDLVNDVTDMQDEDTDRKDDADQSAANPSSDSDAVSDTVTSTPFIAPENPYELVSLILSGDTKGATKQTSFDWNGLPKDTVPEQDPTQEADDTSHSLSEGERDAFDQIAATLGGQDGDLDLPAEELDEDYEDFEKLLASERAIVSELDEGSEQSKQNAPSQSTDRPAGDARDHIPALLMTPADEERADREAQQSSIRRALETRNRSEEALRSAANNAFRDIFAMDPAFRHIHGKLSELNQSAAEDAAAIERNDIPDHSDELKDLPEESSAQGEPDELDAVDRDAVEAEEVSAPEESEPSEPPEPTEASGDDELVEGERAEIEDDETEGSAADTHNSAVAAATLAGVAALGGAALWDREDTASPLIDLLDKLPTAIIVSAEQEILFASRTALRLLGYETASDLSDAGGMEELFTGRPGDWLTKTDGRTTLRGAEGAPISVVANISSINWGERPAAMLSFEESQDTVPEAGVSEEHEKIAELEAILDTATDGVIVLDSDCSIMRMNHSAEALFEVDRHAIAGSSFLDILAEESHKTTLDYFAGLKENGVASVLNDGRDVIGKTSSGGLIPLSVTMGRVAVPGTDRFCVVLRDVAQWCRNEEDLVAEKMAAEAASQQKSDFLAKVSHEIRTPLNAIIGFSEVMMEERFGEIGSPRYKDYLKDIKISGTHIMSLINDLLDLSKVEAGKLDMEFQAVSLNRVITESVGIMQTQANRDQIIIRTSLSSTTPHVAGDDRSLRQIVLNLLSNALKFTSAGGQVIVSTSLEDNGSVALRIRDTGIGMTEEELQTALEPFRQVSTMRNDAEGSGLGLPLSKALIEANHAQMTIKSEKDQGTMVQVTFPKARVVEETPQAEDV